MVNEKRRKEFVDTMEEWSYFAHEDEMDIAQDYFVNVILDRYNRKNVLIRDMVKRQRELDAKIKAQGADDPDLFVWMD